MSIEAKEEFTPKIVAFCCNWCSYAGADLAGSSRLSYPADVKIIRVPCSCRVNPMFILRAFEKGADGVVGVRFTTDVANMQVAPKFLVLTAYGTMIQFVK